MPKIALVSAREALALDEDMPPLVAALRGIGVEPDTPSWDDPRIDWREFDLVVLRSTWDYVDRIDEFLAWTERCASQTRLLNLPDVVRWNTDKHYLTQLAQAGVAVVPTRFVEPGMEGARAMDGFLAGECAALAVAGAAKFEEFVVKPSIGAGSRDAARYRREEHSEARGHLQRLLDAGRSVMLQPYLGQVDHHGETALVYVSGRYSHAFRKGPLLRLGSGLVEGLFATEQIAARQPDPRELEVGAAAIRAIPFATPLYARVDLIRDFRGDPVVLELELTEPSLYFAHAPGAAERFARAIMACASATQPAA
jgi:O-ureido-D-serine cyclo-ligase